MKLIRLALLTTCLWSAWPARADVIGDLKLELLNDALVGGFYDVKSGDLFAHGYTHVFSYKSLVFADIGGIGNSEDGNASLTAGASVGLKETVEKLGGTWILPKRLNIGAGLSYDFTQKKGRPGVYFSVSL